MSFRFMGESLFGVDVSVTTTDIGRDALRGVEGLEGLGESFVLCGGRGRLERTGVPDTV